MIDQDPNDPTTWIKVGQAWAFYLGRPGSLHRDVIEGKARIAIQMVVVETLAANG
jgi:hypothetical protein